MTYVMLLPRKISLMLVVISTKNVLFLTIVANLGEGLHAGVVLHHPHVGSVLAVEALCRGLGWSPTSHADLLSIEVVLHDRLSPHVGLRLLAAVMAVHHAVTLLHAP